MQDLKLIVITCFATDGPGTPKLLWYLAKDAADVLAQNFAAEFWKVLLKTDPLSSRMSVLGTETQLVPQDHILYSPTEFFFLYLQ